MEAGAQKLLESATHRTLHAHNFSRTSSQASNVLTDLLARYLQLLASTCGKYAEHAGRRRLCARDVLSSLSELGLSLSELEEYVKDEGYDLNRYAVRSFRRNEDLNEYRAHLQHGLKLDRDDVLHLQYQPYDGDSDDYESEEDSLPSPPMSPPRKRARLQEYEHIPDFLPPFPTLDPESPRIQPKVEQRPNSPINPQATAAANANSLAVASSALAPDINIRVPYPSSSLAEVPEWHLPQPPDALSSDAVATSKDILPTPVLEHAMTAAYLHILKTRPPTPPAPTPARHRTTMTLLHIAHASNRWDVADTLYGNTAPNLPRVATTGPTFAVPSSTSHPSFLDNNNKKAEAAKLPTGSAPRSIVGNTTIARNVAAQDSRIPDLARAVLNPPVYSRITRLGHPPALMRNNKPLTYGPGVNAQWNSTAPEPVTPAVNGFGKEPENKSVLPDAKLYATWEYEGKDFRIPLHIPGKPIAKREARSGTITLRGRT